MTLSDAAVASCGDLCTHPEHQVAAQGPTHPHTQQWVDRHWPLVSENGSEMV